MSDCIMFASKKFCGKILLIQIFATMLRPYFAQFIK